MRRGLLWSLVLIIGTAAGALAAVVATGHAPLLGLDLRGGVSVVLKPEGKTSSGALAESVSIIDRRVNGLGVTNSDVTRQGKDIVIELPGIKNSANALKVLGSTATLYFRPVDCIIPPYSPPAKSKAPASAKKALGAGGVPAGASLASAVGPLTGGSGPPGAAGTELASAFGPLAAGSGSGASGSGTSSGSTAVPVNSAPSAADCQASNAASLPSTPVTEDLPNKTVILPYYDNSVRYILGPADMKGDVVKNATVSVPSSGVGYDVVVTFTSKGTDQFNKIAAERYPYYKQDPSNPPPQALEAIELDGVVESAPAIEAPSFPGQATISGATSAPFTQKQATNLAIELKYGSLPVRFVPQTIQTVSATIGKDSLKAGLLAGIGGILAVLIYMILYYRALGLVVLVGLGVGGALLYSILTLLSITVNLTLTLAGVTGIIVSIGITVDSYVVYFERLKEEVRSGRSIRSIVEKSFSRAFRTVLTADFVSFMAALILYILTVGDVRGFAFTLGLSTLLDVVTAYLFIRPMVVLVGRRRAFTEARFIGVARGLAASSSGGVG